MSGIMVRKAHASDLPALSAIEASGAETFELYGQPLIDGSPATPTEHWVGSLRAGLLWIADDPHDGPVGFLAAERRDGGLYVAEVDVLMTYQRRGIGRRLVQAAIDCARAECLANLTLTTFGDIPWNAPFYRSLGFVALDDGALPPRLAAALADEAARGFRNRCGMRLCL
jgi:GNAT superfamily N-acetyltransferase